MSNPFSSVTDRLHFGDFLWFSIKKKKSKKDTLKNFAWFCQPLLGNRERCFSSCRVRWTKKKSESTFTDSKLTVFLILFSSNFSFSVFINGKSCIKQVKIINVFFSKDYLSFRCFLSANLRRGSYRRFRNKLTITFNCIALHTKFWNPLLECTLGDIKKKPLEILKKHEIGTRKNKRLRVI